jgi:hypothetical protein
MVPLKVVKWPLPDAPLLYTPVFTTKGTSDIYVMVDRPVVCPMEADTSIIRQLVWKIRFVNPDIDKMNI